MSEIISELARGPQRLRCQRPAGILQFTVPFVVVLLTREETLISCNAAAKANVLTCESLRRPTKYPSQFALRRMDVAPRGTLD
jgi:hypothetical protein